MCTYLNIDKLSNSYATKFPVAKGNYQLRLALNGTDNKTKILARKNFVTIVAFFDRLFHNFFKCERKWVKIYLSDNKSKQPILLNIRSLCQRTLLTRQDVLSKTTHELSLALSNPSILWEYKKLNDHFPHACLINLDKRPDRIKDVTNHLQIIGEKDFKYERLSAVDGSQLPETEFSKMSKSDSAKASGKDDRKGRYACYLSHLNAVKRAKAMNLPNILILEDDVRFTPKYLADAYLQKTLHELPKDWGMLFLGYYEANPSETASYSEHLVKPGRPYDLHAYVVNATMYDTLIAKLEQELTKSDGAMRAIDVVIGEDLAPQGNVFACKNNVAFQDEGISSITGQYIAGNYHKEVVEFKRQYLQHTQAKTTDGMSIMNPLLSGSLYQMAYQMTQVFDKHGIRYWADSGTVLGIERHGALIPHDDDIDICIFPGDETKLEDPTVIADLEKVGLEIAPHWVGSKLQAKKNHPLGRSMHKDGYHFNTPNIDLFFTEERTTPDGKAYFYKNERAQEYWPNFHHLHDDLFNKDNEFKKGDFGPIKLNTNWKGKEYCHKQYGKDCFNEIWEQYDHINERGLTRRPVRLTNYAAPAYKMWRELAPVPNA